MGSLRVSGVKEYGEVDWSAVAGRMHPLDWILERGLPVYCRVDRNLHFAVTRKFRRLKAKQGIEPGPLAPPRIVRFEGKDERLSLLRLDDASVEDLRATGAAQLREFRLGGLAPCRSNADSGSCHGRSELEEVDFEKCVLVDRMRWEALLAHRTPESLHVSFFDMPATLAVYLDALCFEVEDVTAEVASPEAVDWLDYPLAHHGGDPCPHLLWAYRGATAFRERRNVPRAEVTSWLQSQPPKGLFENRLKRTAKNLVPRVYRGENNLRREVFAKLPMAREIDGLPFVNFALKCALAAWYGWQRLDAASASDARERLARMLLDLGFARSAIEDLVQMISGHPMSTLEVTALVECVVQKACMDAAKHSTNSKLHLASDCGSKRPGLQAVDVPMDGEKAELEGPGASGPGRNKPLRYW